MNLKIIGSVFGMTGATGGAIATTFGTTGALGSSLHNVLYTKSWTCLTINSVGEVDDIFRESGMRKEDSIVLNCRLSYSAGQGSRAINYWNGVFPKTLFNSNVLEGEVSGDFLLITESQRTNNYSGNEYQTTLKGENFLNSPIKGLWRRSNQKNISLQVEINAGISEETSSQNKIYLSFTSGDKQLIDSEEPIS